MVAMLPGEAAGTTVERELTALHDRLRIAQREAVAAMTASGAIVALLALLAGWGVV
jgi:hypothetical protein